MNTLILAFLTVTAFAEVGPTDSGHLMVNKKDIKWSPAPASLPAGVQAAVIDGDPTKAGQFTMRLKFPANYKIPPHYHPADEHITVLEGNLSMGMGEKFDEKSVHTLGPGGYFRMTAQTKHFAMTKAPAVIQLHGNGPWNIVYVNPADDPREKAKK